VAQLGSAPVWGTGGRRFKSCLPDHVTCGGEPGSLAMRERLVAAALFLVASSISFPRGSLAATGELGLCSLLQRDDVTRLTAWQVDSVRRKRYDFNGATGAMCFFESTQRTVVLIVPERGLPFPGDSPFADPQDEGVVRRRVHGGASPRPRRAGRAEQPHRLVLRGRTVRRNDHSSVKN
jgi:hypothetical protein